MKLAILVFLCAVIACAVCENCFSVQQCDHVKCDAAHQLGCAHGECTCVNPGSKCSTKSDCSGNCRFGGWHCVDASCHCGWGGFGGGK